MSHLEHALRELEIATAAAAGISLEDIEGSRAILKRRSNAIAQLAAFRDAALVLSPAELREIASRLRSAVTAGEEAQQQLAHSKGKVASEWSRWNHVRRALAPVGRSAVTKIDCRG